MNYDNQTNQIEGISGRQSILFSFLACLCNMLFGFLALPFSSALYAAVILYEKKNRKLFTFLIPAVTVSVNFVLNGVYSLDGILYVIPGVIIALAYLNKKDKGIISFVLSFVFLVLIALSVVVGSIYQVKTQGLTGISQFFADSFYEIKELAISALTEMTEQNEEGIKFFSFNIHEATDLFYTMALAIVPAIMALSFVLSGVSLKIFSAMLYKQTRDKKVFDWRFEVSSVFAYFYATTAILALMIGEDTSIFSLCISAVNTVLMLIFAYLGARFLWSILAVKKSVGFAVIIFVIAFLAFSSLAVAIVSYLGIYYTIIFNRFCRLNGK